MRTRLLLPTALFALGGVLGWLVASSRLDGVFAQDKKTDPQPATDRSKLPMPLSPFEGKIGKTYKESEAAWQKLPTAPAGAPNVVVILLDDVGFGQTSTFGGLIIPTPNLG